MQKDNKATFSIVSRVNHRTLLFIAACVWFFAGGMLIFRGMTGIVQFNDSSALKLMIAIIFGVSFYGFMFRKISAKHIARIKNMQQKVVPFYAFFSLRSYIMMGLMISLGVTLRKTGIVPFEYLSVFYVGMGLPLLFSAFRFLYSGIHFN